MSHSVQSRLTCSCLGVYGHAPKENFPFLEAVLTKNYDAAKLMVGG